MTTTRWWTAGATLVIATIVALGWFLGIDPRLTEAKAAEGDLVSVEALNSTYEQKLVQLEKLDSDLPALKKELATMTAAIPSDAQVSTLLGQLNSLASESGVVLTSITAGVPQLFGAKDAAAAAATPAAPAAGSTASAAPAAQPPATGAPTPTAAADNFVSVPIAVEFTGESNALLSFVQRVQYGTRLFLVNALDITYDAGGGKVKMDGFVYVLTDTAAEAAKTTTQAG